MGVYFFYRHFHLSCIDRRGPSFAFVFFVFLFLFRLFALHTRGSQKVCHKSCFLHDTSQRFPICLSDHRHILLLPLFPPKPPSPPLAFTSRFRSYALLLYRSSALLIFFSIPLHSVANHEVSPFKTRLTACSSTGRPRLLGCYFFCCIVLYFPTPRKKSRFVIICSILFYSFITFSTFTF